MPDTGAMLDVSPIGLPRAFHPVGSKGWPPKAVSPCMAEGETDIRICRRSCSVPIQDKNLGTVCADTILLGDLRAPVVKPAPPSDHTPLRRRCAFETTY